MSPSERIRAAGEVIGIPSSKTLLCAILAIAGADRLSETSAPVQAVTAALFDILALEQRP